MEPITGCTLLSPACANCRSIIRHDKLVYFRGRGHVGKWLSHNPEWELIDKADLPEYRCMRMSVLLPGELPFECPQCGANGLDECWVTETPIKFYENGSVDLGRPAHDERAHLYRCRRCQTLLEDMWGTLINQETLVDHLKCQIVDPA
jgi:hypothetical protein